MITTVIVFLNILLMEIILSIDNASVLAILVNKNLPLYGNSSQPYNPAVVNKERDRALKYGIIGAYVFRGLSLAFVSVIIYNPYIGAWFKIVGGFYLCYLFYTHLTPGADSPEEGNTGWVEKFCKKIGLTRFWSTVIMVEYVDMAFSIDNLLACVSLSSNIWIVIGAVFVGILGMRFVAQYFSKLLTKYPSLEGSAFIVILLLGLKMFLAGLFDFWQITWIQEILNSHRTDMVFSCITLLVFMWPIVKPILGKILNALDYDPLD